MFGDWEDVGDATSRASLAGDSAPAAVDPALAVSGPAKESVAAFLESKGLGKFVQKIIEVTDAESVDDLRLLDAELLEEVVTKADLRLLSAKKLRLAVAELRGEDAAPAGSADPAGSTEAPDRKASAPPQECIAICIDCSGSMGTPFAEVTLNVVKGATRDSVAQRTRMEAVKVMFYAFRDRVESAGLGTHQLGLLQFDNRIERLLEVTHRLDFFERIVDDMEKRGATAIYSAIIEAARMLGGHFCEDSQTDLRILVLTDGQNNSGALPQEALQAANGIGAVVDAIIVGDRPDANLRRIVSATGGECYQINDLGEGFELLEAEGVASLRARRGGAEKPRFRPREAVHDFAAISEKQLTRGTEVQRAPALAPEIAARAVVDIMSQKGTDLIAAVPSSGGGGCVKRILMELKQVASGAASVWMHSGEGIHIFPAPDNVKFWRALIEGPQGTPFEGGVFALSVVLPDSYPFNPPKVTFQTLVYHCNVSDAGSICLEILKDRWNPALTVPKCLEAIRMMLKDPNTDDALRQWIAELTLAHEKSNGADTRYYDKAREATQRDASTSVAEWKQTQWGC